MCFLTLIVHTLLIQNLSIHVHKTIDILEKTRVGKVFCKYRLMWFEDVLFGKGENTYNLFSLSAQQ